MEQNITLLPSTYPILTSAEMDTTVASIKFTAHNHVAMKKALIELTKYFTSGNNISVSQATI